MDIKIDEKKKLVVITLPLEESLPLSSTGKTHLVAGTGGFKQSMIKYKDKVVSVSCNVCVPVDKK